MPGRAISGFRTGIHGLGHLALVYGDREREKAAEFYQNTLGFRVSSFMEWGKAIGSPKTIFLHCNPREHTVGIISPFLDAKPGTLQHIMVEVNSLDDVGRAYDLCMVNNIPIGLTIGKHTNDGVTSFYVITPSGIWIEYGYGGISVADDTWRVQSYRSPSIWGHHLQQGATIALRPE